MLGFTPTPEESPRPERACSPTGDLELEIPGSQRPASEARRSGVPGAGLRTRPPARSHVPSLSRTWRPRPHLPAPPWPLGWRQGPRLAREGGDPLPP